MFKFLKSIFNPKSHNSYGGYKGKHKGQTNSTSSSTALAAHPIAAAFATEAKKKAQKEDLYAQQGVKKYVFNEGEVWARNLKNALHKAEKLGYTMLT